MDNYFFEKHDTQEQDVSRSNFLEF